jgi:rubrerythrin
MTDMNTLLQSAARCRRMAARCASEAIAKKFEALARDYEEHARQLEKTRPVIDVTAKTQKDADAPVVIEPSTSVV